MVRLGHNRDSSLRMGYMDQKRFIPFLLLSMMVLIGWNVFVLPRFLPPPKDKEQQAEKDHAENADAHENGEQRPNEDGAPGEEKAVAIPGAPADENDAGKNEAGRNEGEKVVKKPDVPQFELKSVKLGSMDFDSGYREQVVLTSHGAAIEEILLNDPRYRTLEKHQHNPLAIVTHPDAGTNTLEIGIPQLPANIAHLNWELVDLQPAEAPHSKAVFRIRVDNFEVVKSFELSKLNLENPGRSEAPAYAVDVSLTFKNLGKKQRKFNYVLQGPVGLPLENVENTQKFRDVAAGFVNENQSINHQLMTAAKIAKKETEEWKNPVKYIGVDVQFFAALLVPSGNQAKENYFQSIKQVLVGPDLKEKSDVSCQLTSVNLELAPNGTGDDSDQVVHSYQLFAGPKRPDILPDGTNRIIDYGSFFGTFRIDFISHALVHALKLFHGITGSWGIAIIFLTVCVRGAMFPISFKQARSAAKMQEMQPEIAALKEKYGNEKEKLARAQMELFRKYNHNPFTGCLPLLLQLPIFMGLYSALNHAVELRLAGFLWVENLAAPDMLWRMPVSLPFIGQNFNLLPIITITLFVVQPKMFMPPPASEEQRIQYKVMNFMMIFMGVMFYKVPAGLCVYFIASSLWGLGERKLIPKSKPKTAPAVVADNSDRNKRKGKDDDDDKSGGNGQGGGLWNMILKAAEKETEARREGNRRK